MNALRVARYRLRATWSRRRAGYLAIVLLIALVGGVSMGALAAARRTQSAFPIYAASTKTPQLTGITDFVSGLSGAAGLGYDPARLRAIARLPHVQSVISFAGLNTVPLDKHGVPISVPDFRAEGGEGAGSLVSISTLVKGFGSSIVAGRLPNPSRPDEFAVSPATAQHFHLHVGEVMPFGVYTNAQTLLPNFGTAAIKPYRRFDGTLVGIAVSGNEIVEDDVDALDDNLFIFSEALTRPLLTCCTAYTPSSVVVAGNRYVQTVQREISNVLPKGFPPFAANPGILVVTKAERAIKPESIALGVFGGITALAALLIGAQLIGRELRQGAEELETLRALGAPPTTTIADGLLGVAAALGLGALLAVAVAIGLSPLAPLGPTRPVYPYPGVSFDWTVLGTGLAVLFVALSGIAVLLAGLQSPHRLARQGRGPKRRSPLVGAAASAGLPPTAVTGIRFALEPGSGASATPVRSAILGAALAVVTLIATGTFGASLDSLVAHPALYGWNWNYEITAGEGSNIPPHELTKLLNADPHIAAWTSAKFNEIEIDGVPIPTIGVVPGATVAPPVLTGHGVDGTNQIVLGGVTLAQLHRHVGDSVTIHTNRLGRSRTLRIVGTATLPTIGVGGNVHPEMGTGALVPQSVFPHLPGSNGPNAVLVRLRNANVGLRSLQQIAGATSTPADDGVFVLSVERPAEIVNYRSMGTIPAFLGGGLALGAVLALALTLVASVRRRRRELAALKTLGFTGRQLAATVAWQSSVAVAIGTIIGVPIGIIVGRTLWDLFATEINVVPSPSVPVLLIVLIALGALLLANVVAVVPGWSAARTPTDLLFRAE